MRVSVCVLCAFVNVDVCEVVTSGVCLVDVHMFVCSLCTSRVYNFEFRGNVW